MRKKRETIALFLILFFSLTTFQNIVFVGVTATGDEHGNTYINEDGSIEPSDSPIHKNGNVYTLTGNLHGKHLTILRSHITFDGNGYTLYQSISLKHVTHVTVKNLLVTNPTPGVSGISIDHASNNIIQNNTLWGCGSVYQMGLKFAAIHILGGDSNVIVGNNITKNEIGLIFPNQTILIYNNSFIDNNLDVSGSLSSNAVFDNGELGNYWSRYNGKDENGDGIGDIPFKIDNNKIDYYPLVNPVGNPNSAGNSGFPFSIIIPLFLTATLVIIFLRKKLKKRIREG